MPIVKHLIALVAVEVRESRFLAPHWALESSPLTGGELLGEARRCDVRKASISSRSPPMPAKLAGHATGSTEALKASIRYHVP